MSVVVPSHSPHFNSVNLLALLLFIFWYSKEVWTNPRSQRFSLLISSTSFIALAFIFRTMIHFELDFCIVWGKS